MAASFQPGSDVATGGAVQAQVDTQVTQGRGLFLRGIRLVWSYVRAHPRPFSISVAGAFLYAVASIGLTAVLGRVTDQVLRPAFSGGVAASKIWAGVAAIMLMGSLRALGIMVRRYYSGVAGARVMATLRTRVADRYRELSMQYHRETPTGELLAHMEADVEAAVDVLHPVPFACGVLFLVLFAMIALIATDPFLAAIGFLLFPTLAMLNRSFARRMEGPVRRAQERIGQVSTVAHESIDGALIVKTLGREDAETERLGVKARALRDERVDAGYVRAGFEPALEALPTIGTVLLLAVGAWRVSTGAVTVGDLIEFVTLFGLLSWPMRFVGWILSELPRAVVGYDRLERVFAEQVTVPAPVHPRALPAGPLAVEVEHVSYTYGGDRVLDDVSFRIAPDETVAIVGRTGVGKSTLAQLLVRLDDPTEGVVRVGGIDLRDADAGSLRDATAIVFQESFLFAAPVGDNIALASGADRERVEHSAGLAQADRFIRALPSGYDTVVGERGHTLSGGQRQRAALARALVREPRLLILDDATSAVDPTIEAQILGGLRRELRTTLVLVAYRLSTIRLADRVLFLEDGRLAATGSHDELVASMPGYAGMIRAYELEER
jgi:ABC-type multidrug transport system fused ATPase/permease subunit